MAKRILVDFEVLSNQCPYNVPVEDGWACSHQDAEDAELVSLTTGKSCGCCSASSCPIAAALDIEDLDDPELGMDGTERDDVCDDDGEICDEEAYAILVCDDSASEDERLLLGLYQHYMHRYDKEWLEAHKEDLK